MLAMMAQRSGGCASYIMIVSSSILASMSSSAETASGSYSSALSSSWALCCRLWSRRPPPAVVRHPTQVDVLSPLSTGALDPNARLTRLGSSSRPQDEGVGSFWGLIRLVSVDTCVGAAVPLGRSDGEGGGGSFGLRHNISTTSSFRRN